MQNFICSYIPLCWFCEKQVIFSVRHFVFVDYAFSTETVIVGDGGSQFLYRGDTAINRSNNKASSSAAIALLFSTDRGKPSGMQLYLNWNFAVSNYNPVCSLTRALFYKAFGSERTGPPMLVWYREWKRKRDWACVLFGFSVVLIDNCLIIRWWIYRLN